MDQLFLDSIRQLPQLSDNCPPLSQLLMWEKQDSGLSCYYAPFEYLNTKARLILVGITPGNTQMNHALNAARLAISDNTPVNDAIREIKKQGSFSGAMRSNLVNTLNRLGYQYKLGITCASELWGGANHLVHFCSLLKYPVFLNGKDYNGKPKVHKDPFLRKMMLDHFVNDLVALPHDAALVPLGDTVLEVLVWLKQQNLVPQDLPTFEGRYIAPPHPSGANAESVALLLEPVYPDKHAYADRMYAEYLKREPWKRKTGKPQPEAKYKAARYSRWESMLIVRKAHRL